MFTTIGVVDLVDSARQISGHRLAGQPILTRTIRQMTDSLGLVRVVAVLGKSDRDQLESLVPADVDILETDAPDALGRLAAAAAVYDADAIVRVRQNFPLVDPVLIDRLICDAKQHPGCDYISYCSNDGRPSVLVDVGLFAEWCRATAICSADTICRDSVHRQHGTSFLYSNPLQYHVRLIPAPTSLNCDAVRLAVANREDCERLEEIVEALGSDNLGWKRIAELVDTHPSVRQRHVEGALMVD